MPGAGSKRLRANPESGPLSDAVTHLLEECRMVLPGIQTLFGFQLIAVFNQVFWDKLEPHEQIFHFAAICLVAVSVALVMAPAAYHRLAEPKSISGQFITISTFFLSASMYPLMVALSVDLYLIGRVILDSRVGSLALTALLFAGFVFLWIIFPRATSLHERFGR